MWYRKKEEKEGKREKHRERKRKKEGDRKRERDTQREWERERYIKVQITPLNFLAYLKVLLLKWPRELIKFKVYGLARILDAYKIFINV